MCGISGVYSPSNPPNTTELDRMNTCLSHRGPDDASIYESGPIGLAHRRLAIIDPESGDQPITNEDGSIVVVFNGEIYNYSTLRTDLQSSGHQFETETDTEVLVHLYEENGLDFVKNLQGMFAFALWDSNLKRLVLARDQIGIKPLYIGKDDERITFGSELGSILAANQDHGGLNQEGIARYLAVGFISAPQTAFTNVRKLCPGEIAVADADGLQIHRYHTPKVRRQDPGFEAAAQEIRSQVDNAVKRRLMSDVSLGAFLSGGIDSSIIVGSMAEIGVDPVRTFTVGFESEQFDESWAAEAVANYHNTDHHEFIVSPEDVRKVIPEVVSQMSEPFGDPSIIPTYIVSRETSSEVSVALSGDGADELFAGYDRYRGEYYARYYRALPRSLRTSLIEPVINNLPASRSSSTGEAIRKAQKFLRGGEANDVRRHLEWMRIPEDAAVEAININSLSEVEQDLQKVHSEVQGFLPDDRQDTLSRIQAADVRYTLPNQMLQKVDRASMYNSLEVRVPFLDTNIVEYSMGLPTEYKINASNRKRVLKYAFKDRLPDQILNREKRGFDVPIGEWFKGPLMADFKETLEAASLPFLDKQSIEKVFHQHVSGRRDHEWFLWNIYVLSHWHLKLEEENLLD